MAGELWDYPWSLTRAGLTPGLGGNIVEEQSIELDAPPGAIRPFELLTVVLRDTGFTSNDFDNPVPLFGHCTFTLTNKAKSDLFEKVRYSVIKPRIEKLYQSGAIRYGSW